MRLLDGDEARAHRADPARHAWSAPRTARSTPRWTRAATCGRSRPPPNGRGATIVEGAAARTFERDGGRITRVETDIGPDHGRPGRARRRRLDAVPRCASSASSIPIHPMRLQIVQTEPMPPRLDVRAVRAGGGQAVRDLPRAAVVPAGDFATDARGPARAGPARVGLPDAPTARTCSACAMDFPGFDWKPDLAGVSLVAEGMAAAHARAAAPRVSRGPGPASCR